MTEKNIFKFQIFLASLINMFKYTRRNDIFLELPEFSKICFNFFLKKNSKFEFEFFSNKSN